MSDNDSFGGTPLILERKIISREGAGIEVTQLKMSQAWYDGMARAIERGREDARKRTFSYQLKQFFADLFSRTPPRSNDG
jgi:hypothetical protein